MASPETTTKSDRKRPDLRGTRGKLIIDRYRFLTTQDLSDSEAITDLVADIGHLCLDRDLPFLHLVTLAIAHWHQEIAGDPGSPLGPRVSILIDDQEVAP